MKIYRAKDYNDMSRKAANLISAQILLKPNCVLGLATGSTPLGGSLITDIFRCFTLISVSCLHFGQN